MHHEEEDPYPTRAAALFACMVMLTALIGLYNLANYFPSQVLSATPDGNTGDAWRFKPALLMFGVPIASLLLGGLAGDLARIFNWGLKEAALCTALCIGVSAYCLTHPSKPYLPEPEGDYKAFRLYRAGLRYDPSQPGYVPYERPLSSLQAGERGYTVAWLVDGSPDKPSIGKNASVFAAPGGTADTVIVKIDNKTCLVNGRRTTIQALR